VESNGGVPDDWFELVNVGTTTIDISGWKMLDNDDTHTPYVFPARTTIAPGAYLVVDTGGTGFNFGLGAADSVRIFTPAGVLYESYSWTSHAATTYGRCPDGTGAFTTTTSSTKGAKNDCSSPVRLNEVESNGGVPDDWFELYNAGAVPADISGWKMLDNDDTHTPYVFPSGTVMAPGAFLVVDTGVTGFNFGLGAADSVRIFDAAGNLVDSYSWTAHAATTYGRCPDGTGPFVTTAASTKGAANSCSTAATTSVKLNEVESDGGVPDDWFELFNAGTTAADISGWKMLDNDDTHTPYVFPAGTVMAPGAFLVVDTGATDSISAWARPTASVFSILTERSSIATPGPRMPPLHMGAARMASVSSRPLWLLPKGRPIRVVLPHPRSLRGPVTPPSTLWTGPASSAAI
jgi:hypothetical protein